MYMPFFYDPTMIILIPAFLLALYAQYKVKATINKFNKKYSKSGFTGAEVARKLLKDYNISNVKVQQIEGLLGDHYDPGKKVLNLSKNVYNDSTISAIGIAAHETGHAIQDATGYKPLSLRASLVPVANIGSSWGLPMAIFGFFLRAQTMIWAGLIFYLAAVLFHIVTLPVEINASNRAIVILHKGNYLDACELEGAKKVLRAAAFTYIAATLVAITNLLRIFMLLGMGRDDN